MPPQRSRDTVTHPLRSALHTMLQILLLMPGNLINVHVSLYAIYKSQARRNILPRAAYTVTNAQAAQSSRAFPYQCGPIRAVPFIHGAIEKVPGAKLCIEGRTNT
jgi:hypothetical protein